uniref:Uncharacterized protein n=1 Tax=Hyaloperonospora arabidopsidis (strain Emoy2) TaxID=559515 RepID=M4BCX2_HYAAE
MNLTKWRRKSPNQAYHVQRQISLYKRSIPDRGGVDTLTALRVTRDDTEVVIVTYSRMSVDNVLSTKRTAQRDDQ